MGTNPIYKTPSVKSTSSEGLVAPSHGPPRVQELSSKDIVLGSEIASGSFGVVYSGTCVQAPVAIKVFKLLDKNMQQELDILK